MSFNRGVTVKILGLNKIGVVVDINRDSCNQPVYDVDCDGKVYVCMGHELDGSLKETKSGQNTRPNARSG